MGWGKKFMSFLGISRDDGHVVSDSSGMMPREEEERNGHQLAGEGNRVRRGGGFSVTVPVLVERPHLDPVLVECPQGDGGIQGLNWCYFRLRMDDDGDVANEILELDHVPPQTPDTSVGFVVKSDVQALRGRVNEIAVADGKVLHNISVQGDRMWV